MRGLWQWMHSRHCGENSVTTWSPSARSLDALADRLDDAGALVPEHGRRIAGRIDAGGGVHVGVADAAGDEPHEHLAGARLGEVELLHDERLAELLEHAPRGSSSRAADALASRSVALTAPTSRASGVTCSSCVAARGPCSARYSTASRQLARVGQRVVARRPADRRR